MDRSWLEIWGYFLVTLTSIVFVMGGAYYIYNMEWIPSVVEFLFICIYLIVLGKAMVEIGKNNKAKSSVSGSN